MANIVNKGFTYDDQKLWYDEAWADRQSPTEPLIMWIGENDTMLQEEIKDDVKYPPFAPDFDLTTLPNYSFKEVCLNDPEHRKKLASEGIYYEPREVGHLVWIPVLPTRSLKTFEDRIPMLFVYRRVDYNDPYWALKMMDRYEEYNRMAEKENILIVYLAIDSPDQEGVNQFPMILQEVIALFPGDPARAYLDVSPLLDAGKKIHDAPGYVYTDLAGNPIDPDENITYLSPLKIPIIDVSRRWEVKDSLTRNLVMNYTKTNSNPFQREKLIHSIHGMKMAEGLRIEHDFDDINDPKFREYWAERGLELGIHKTKSERWISMVPMNALEDKSTPLPVVLILQEVNYSNEHLPITAISYFYEYNKIAQNGDCILIYFVLEDPDSNDLMVDILEDAKKMYPIDASRIYVTGHSHDGHYALEYARRHPKNIAAVATVGNLHGLPTEEYCHDAVFQTDENLDEIAAIDMPLINIRGCCEGKPRPRHEEIASWQRRLWASNCPPKTIEEIAMAKEKGSLVERMTGYPADRGEILYADGFEHYIADYKNNNGDWHLRIVSIEGQAHYVTPFMCELSWAFMRRFARDQESGKLIELY